MRPHVALGTGAVRGTGCAIALCLTLVSLDAVIEVPSNRAGNATAAMANALTSSCLFIARILFRPEDQGPNDNDQHRQPVHDEPLVERMDATFETT
jgi:hypothetical protein